MPYSLFNPEESGTGNNLIKSKEIKGKKIEYTDYWTRYVRIVECKEKNSIFYTVEVTDVGKINNTKEVMCKSIEEAEKQYEIYSSCPRYKYKEKMTS